MIKQQYRKYCPNFSLPIQIEFLGPVCFLFYNQLLNLYQIYTSISISTILCGYTSNLKKISVEIKLQ